MDQDRLIWAAVGVVWLAVAVLTRRSRPTAVLSALVAIAWWAPGALPAAVLWHRGPLIHLLLAAGAWWPRSRLAQAVVMTGYALSAFPAAWPNLAVTAIASVALVAALVAEHNERPLSLARRPAWQAGVALVVLALVTPSALAWAGAGTQWSSAVLFAYTVDLMLIGVLVVAGARPASDLWVADVAVDLGSATDQDLWGTLEPSPADPESVRLEVEEARSAATTLRTRLLERQAELDETLRDLRASWARLTDADHAARRELAERLAELTEQRLNQVIDELEEVTSYATGGAASAAHRAGMHLVRAREELQALGRGLLVPALADGLEPALMRLAITSPIEVQVDAAEEALEPLPPEVAATAYFVVAEAVTNAVKHADASRVRVSVTRQHGCLELAVVDDGAGGAAADGPGLSGVRDRTLESGGTFDLSSPLGSGTAVRITLPVGDSLGTAREGAGRG